MRELSRDGSWRICSRRDPSHAVNAFREADGFFQLPTLKVQDFDGAPLGATQVGAYTIGRHRDAQSEGRDPLRDLALLLSDFSKIRYGPDHNLVNPEILRYYERSRIAVLIRYRAVVRAFSFYHPAFSFLSASSSVAGSLR
jgi:hypothetical protein